MNNYFSKLTDEEYEFIKGEATHIFEKYDIKCIPVSGFEVASKMKITLIAYSGLSNRQLKEVMKVSKDGFYIEKDGREFIFYNDFDRHYERQNWTILHEIGHIVLDHTGCANRSEHEEDEANFFAKYAIAPPVLIHKIGAKSLHDVYKAFDISLEAAKYAYDYYCSWKTHYEKVGKLTVYEEKLLEIYERMCIESQMM